MIFGISLHSPRCRATLLCNTVMLVVSYYEYTKKYFIIKKKYYDTAWFKYDKGIRGL